MQRHSAAFPRDSAGDWFAKRDAPRRAEVPPDGRLEV